MHSQQQSRLLRLPVELQLAIFEYAIIESEPLLLNCGCDSSYGGNYQEWHADEERWTSREKHPPQQPGLTGTCAAVRSVTLPMFYQQNAFRAHYCFEADLDMAVAWLKRIGPTNRRLLRNFCCWDKNRHYDNQMPKDLKRVRRSDLVRDMGGSLETLKVDEYCCHRVIFGDGDNDHYEMVQHLFDG